jgi:hypothetical protein
MNRKIIRLTESDLHRIVKESVKRVINETLNPLSWTEKANQHEKDGSWTPEQIKYARQRGIKAFNSTFGDDNTKMNDDGSIDTKGGETLRTIPGKDGRFMSLGDEHAVMNKNGTWDLTHKDYTTPDGRGGLKMTNNPTSFEWNGEKTPWNLRMNDGGDVATQMLGGKENFRFNKKKGWARK